MTGKNGQRDKYDRAVPMATPVMPAVRLKDAGKGEDEIHSESHECVKASQGRNEAGRRRVFRVQIQMRRVGALSMVDGLSWCLGACFRRGSRLEGDLRITQVA